MTERRRLHDNRSASREHRSACDSHYSPIIMNHKLLLLPLVVATLAAGTHMWSENDVAAEQRREISATLGPFGVNAEAVLTPKNLDEMLAPRPRDEWRPRPNDERPRGGVETYAAVAPAVVVVRTEDGHGTGFLVSEDGLILTNHHVISSGLTHEATASFASVHFGRLEQDGVMDLESEPRRAMLLKIDALNDLALLRIEPHQRERSTFRYINLSKAAPRPGLDCSIIGHPSSGMLWTFRPCQVASIGTWPKDLVNLVLPRLAAVGAAKTAADEFVASEPGHKILLTSAQANPGDSGGPVLDASGALIGVTFAGPGNTAEDKFTYHVHLDEVRKFLANVPRDGMLLVPDPWDLPARVELRDLDGNGKPDVLVAGTENPEVLVFDVDEDSSLSNGRSRVARLVREKQWDFEFALDLRGGGYTSYYDTDNDGAHDLVLVTDENSLASKGQFLMATAKKRWIYQSRRGKILDRALFRNPELARRLTAVFERLNTGAQ
jgi:S1-C subfamily serine protease